MLSSPHPTPTLCVCVCVWIVSVVHIDLVIKGQLCRMSFSRESNIGASFCGHLSACHMSVCY